VLPFVVAKAHPAVVQPDSFWAAPLPNAVAHFAALFAVATGAQPLASVPVAVPASKLHPFARVHVASGVLAGQLGEPTTFEQVATHWQLLVLPAVLPVAAAWLLQFVCELSSPAQAFVVSQPLPPLVPASHRHVPFGAALPVMVVLQPVSPVPVSSLVHVAWLGPPQPLAVPFAPASHVQPEAVGQFDSELEAAHPPATLQVPVQVHPVFDSQLVRLSLRSDGQLGARHEAVDMLQPVVAAHWAGVVVSAVGHDGAVHPYQVQVGPVTQVANVDPHESPLAGMQLFSW
jgi:hypothetical protein